ncbi:unnamed protein product [Rotaria socialis]|uniref:Uncharacterized protein n=2 Tax=Rotaria socialis TaxID=392032 RepID=A0A818UC98_9BILA|nr:unnamed protein product [Rotaria socialis]
MRKRNNIIFNLVESEREYVHQLEILVANYVRPFRMAASSKKPLITHEDANSIFLNSEIILFLHQIFYKGLSKKLEQWPTFYTGDLFDMFISMLHIYLEYVRNHHYSLQNLVECKLSNPEFNKFLERCETKAACEGLTLETLLVLPMNRIPYYIITLVNCLSHTPHVHVEREKLEQAKDKLEELSKIMHDEVSETEHIRANLAIERSIAEGCDVLLDVNQVLCRQGGLVLWTGDKVKQGLNQKLSAREIRRNEIVVQCYLFSNHLIITTRASNGKLHLVKICGVIALAEVTLVDDISTDPQYIPLSVADDEATDDSNSTSTIDLKNGEFDSYISRLFRLIVEPRDQPSYSTTLIANDENHKSEWCSDIAQCLQNLRYSNLLSGTFRNESSVIAPESVKFDAKLYKDDSGIKYCKTLDSCKIPQIRHATVERLVERLTDLRFLSIDFLNTFLLTYRLYTDAYTVMETLIRIYKSSPQTSLDHTTETDGTTTQKNDEQNKAKQAKINEQDTELTRQVPAVPETSVADTSEQDHDPRRLSHTGIEQSEATIMATTAKKTIDKKLLVKSNEGFSLLPTIPSIDIDDSNDQLHPPLAPLASSETFSDVDALHRDTQSQLKVKKLSVDLKQNGTHEELSRKTTKSEFDSLEKLFDFPSSEISNEPSLDIESTSRNSKTRIRFSDTNQIINANKDEKSVLHTEKDDSPSVQQQSRVDSNTAATAAQANQTASQNVIWLSKRLSEVLSSPRQSLRNAAESSYKKVLPGVVVTSSRSSRRRISSAAATQAFAVATSGESPKVMRNERLASSPGGNLSSPQSATTGNPLTSISKEQRANECAIANTASTMRVLNVLRHWLTKHPLDFHKNPKLKEMVLELLQDMLVNGHLIAAEHKAAVGILKQLETNEAEENAKQLCMILHPIQNPNATFEQIAVSDLAEQMTLIDHKLFCALDSEELLLQGWMKPGRDDLAPNVALISRRFNEMCRLVITEILSQSTINDRIQCIEKWGTVADICRYLRNFNGVLQIMAAFVNSSVYRLKQTWDRISKQSKHVINKLQSLVHSDGKFKNLRDTLTKVDPPCIPYLGLYLSDLTFIEESSQDISEFQSVNFSKMRMKTHIISEIRRFQSTPFKIKHNPRVCAYLLNSSQLLSEDQCYGLSLKLEPRASRAGMTNLGV